MAREAIKVELYGENSAGVIRRYTVADGNNIPKGTILKLGSDPRTAAASVGTSDLVAGIASEEKEASDGATSIGVWTHGVFDLVASGAITLGAWVVTAAPGNYVKQATGADMASSFAIILGKCLETASDGETVNIAVNIT